MSDSSPPPASRSPTAPMLLPTRPRRGDPPRKKAHLKDLVRLERYQKLIADGVPDDDAVCRTVCDPGIGLREYVLDPTRINRIGEIARARARLFRWAAPEQLERVAVKATARLAASADKFVEVIEEVAAGDGMTTSDDAQVARARTEAAKFGLGACGVAPKTQQGPTTTVNIQQYAAWVTANHHLTAKAGERMARTLRYYRGAVELLLGACPDAELAAKVTAKLAEITIDVRPCRDVDFERRFAER